jgi:hypothetical protein
VTETATAREKNTHEELQAAQLDRILADLEKVKIDGAPKTTTLIPLRRKRSLLLPRRKNHEASYCNPR